MIEIEHVSIGYGDAPVVRDVSLVVPSGGWLTLIGPNGAGKTSVLRAVAGLVGHEGCIALGGVAVRDLAPREIARRVAVVPQEPEVPPGMTVGEYVLLGRTPHQSYLAREGAHDRRVAGEVIERLQMGALASRELGRLSGGERRRAVIGRALAQQALILLLDEPTTALDVGRQQEVLDLIDDLRKQDGLTVLAAMHDLTLAGQYAEELALLVDGEMVDCGSADQVLTRTAIERHYGARVRVLPVLAGRAVVPVRDQQGGYVRERGLMHPDPDPLPPVEPPRRATTKATSLVLVNTGDGKGKSTAAFGTALRAAAAGWRVCVVQFVKSGKWRTGEQKASATLGIDWWTTGDGFTWDSSDMDETEAVAREGWRTASNLLGSGDHRLIVLDEITYPINWGWIPIVEVVDAISARPAHVSVIVTGRDASTELIAIADTVTEMRNEKHAFDQGVRAMRGIDF